MKPQGIRMTTWSRPFLRCVRRTLLVFLVSRKYSKFDLWFKQEFSSLGSNKEVESKMEGPKLESIQMPVTFSTKESYQKVCRCCRSQQISCRSTSCIGKKKFFWMLLSASERCQCRDEAGLHFRFRTGEADGGEIGFFEVRRPVSDIALDGRAQPEDCIC